MATSKTNTTKSSAPTMSLSERVGFEASVSLSKDFALVRGWNVGSSEAVQAKVEAYNEREYKRCEAAALALLDL